MRLRLPALLAMCALLLLAACGDTADQPSPTNTTAPVPPTNTVADASQPPPPAETPVTGVSDTPAAAEPTALPATEPPAAEDSPLQLQPVVVETNDATRNGVFAQERTVNLPPGFHIRVFANGLSGVRWLGLSPDGMVYATVRGESRVVTLPDADKDGVADSANTFAEGIRGVHGIAFNGGAVYVATETDIIRLEDTDGDGAADKRDVIANDLPPGGGHSTRTLAFGPDGKLYVAAGSSCNVCNETNPKRAAISRYSADGTFEKVYATGLRNAVGMIFHPITGEMWATNNGRDQIGDDIPPETIYNVKEDTDYGWPFCYGARVPDTAFGGTAERCANTGVPAVEMQAHSAPLGLDFYMADQFPEQFKGDLFVAFHGSWNRSVPTGYKVVRIRMNDNQVDTSAGNLLVEDFATGWLTGGGVWGRPVNPMVGPDGSLLLTDDEANAIYSIYYQENAGP